MKEGEKTTKNMYSAVYTFDVFYSSCITEKAYYNNIIRCKIKIELVLIDLSVCFSRIFINILCFVELMT